MVVTLAMSVADPWVEERVGQVHHEIDEHVQARAQMMTAWMIG